jgi:hypothetical protein
MALHTWSAKKFVIVIGGIPLTGFGDDAILTLTPAEADYEKKIGADGNVTRSANPGNVFDGTLTLMQTSLSNAQMTTIRELGRALPGSDVKTIMVKDLLGNDIMSAPTCYIEQMGDITRAKEANVQEWNIVLVDPIIVLGGSLQNVPVPI